jgi:hypothetical protein
LILIYDDFFCGCTFISSNLNKINATAQIGSINKSLVILTKLFVVLILLPEISKTAMLDMFALSNAVMLTISLAGLG